MRIIATLTTTPRRIGEIRKTLNSVLNQTIPIEAIEINVPYILKRSGEEYQIPEWLSQLEAETKNTKCEVRIFRTEDFGAITKIAPTLFRYQGQKDVFAWSIDDDVEYPVNMLATIFREYMPDRDYVLCHSGAEWKFDSEDFCIGYNPDRRERDVHFAEGHATIFYPAGLVQEDFEDYIFKTTQTDDTRNSDDIIISNYFALKNIKIHCCAYPYREQSLFLVNRALKYGMNSQALHKQGGGNQKRYIRVFNWLKENNLNGWVKNGLV